MVSALTGGYLSSQRESTQDHSWSALSRSLFGGGLAAITSGLIFLGIGSRLVMRLIALINPDARGAESENGNFVGDITVDGTISLILFAGLFGGLIGGAAWLMVRDWLPTSRRLAIVSFGIIAMLTGSFFVIEKDNPDFVILGPLWVLVVLFVVILGLWGFGTAYLDTYFQRVLPRGRLLAAGYALLLAGTSFVAMVLLLQGFLTNDEHPDPPRVAGGFLLLAAAVTILRRGALLFGYRETTKVIRWSRVTGVATVAALTISGGFHLASRISEMATD